MKGQLIVIEGLDGSGKATQANRLFETLQAQGKPVRKVSFPDYASDSSAPIKMYLAGEFGKDPNSVNAYAASTGLIIPMEGEVLSLVGISQIQETVEAVQRSSNPDLKVLGIVMNKFSSRSILNREMLDLAEEIAAQMGSKVFSSKIRRGVDVATAPAHGQSVMTFRANSKPAMDLRKLVDAVAGDQFPRKR